MTTSSATLPLPEAQWGRLLDAHQAYLANASPFYDEAFREVAARIDVRGSLSKADIGALVFWKRLNASTRWARELHALDDERVRNVTGAAVAHARDEFLSVGDSARAGRRALSDLPGFHTGDALASAVLTAAAPARMAIYDRRADKGLRELGIELTPKPGRYGQYMDILDSLVSDARRRGKPLHPRDLDLALFQLGAAEKGNKNPG